MTVGWNTETLSLGFTVLSGLTPLVVGAIGFMWRSAYKATDLRLTFLEKLVAVHESKLSDILARMPSRTDIRMMHEENKAATARNADKLDTLGEKVGKQAETLAAIEERTQYIVKVKSDGKGA